MRNSKEVIQLIEQLRKEKKMTLGKLAEKTGVSKSTLSRYESGKREFPINNISKYASALNTTIEHLLGIENLYAVHSESINVPIVGQISCGDPIIAEENLTGYRTEPKTGLPSGSLFYLHAEGNSMLPTIPQGAYVLIREQPDVESGEIAAVLLNDNAEATLKRIRKDNDYIILTPDNNQYRPTVIDEKNPCKIIGKAIRYTFDL
ncbi:LexA family protein [Lentibacillus amyloliquefaciens]|uniref:XRE family transcriptional regulator n=1 Tax=Lentibacillus amyloliquefaciens TaxID=1472767 RepID=A0A0U3WD27_9BACI|nr:LexA family transcriptional regulator [Lentibacillus amyloliquefaciens]ALX47695.1 XRE family transcriptional regulator [Lentibacillus amyloliquefaciens]